MRGKLIAGFDLSCNSTGVCIINEKRSIVHAESINPYPLDGVQRLNYIYDRLLAVMNSYDIEYVGFEKQVQQQRYSYSAGSILTLAEVVGVFKLAMYKSGLYDTSSVYAFRPQVLKESLSGDPKADKEKMMESIGIRSLNHLKSNISAGSVNDCADAYAAADAVLRILKNDFKYDFDEIVSNKEESIKINQN